MKNNIQKKRQEGFTIIEVLIVLAIAGLIILIVFLAVPALQRNSRNTQRKNDVSAIGGALSEFVNNNNGQLPDDQTEFNDKVSTNSKLSYYDPATVTYTKNTSATVPTAPTGIDSVAIFSYAKCDGNTPVDTSATSRSVIALYNVESGGDDVLQCQEL